MTLRGGELGEGLSSGGDLWRWVRRGRGFGGRRDELRQRGNVGREGREESRRVGADWVRIELVLLKGVQVHSLL